MESQGHHDDPYETEDIRFLDHEHEGSGTNSLEKAAKYARGKGLDEDGQVLGSILLRLLIILSRISEKLSG